MALIINDACTACDACEPVCPNKAITAGNPFYVIDPMKCTECVGAEDEPQCKLVCPVECIVQNPAGALAVFIPWRVGAEESGAAKLLDLRGPPGRCSGCWPHDGKVAGGAVAD